MNKLNQLIESLTRNNLVSSNDLLEELLKEKIKLKLEEKRIEFAQNLLAIEQHDAPHIAKLKKHIRFIHPHLARERNLASDMKREKLLDKLSKEPVTEDKNPARIKHAQAEKILATAGYKRIRSGEHQSIWKHEKDSTRELFPLPHHSRELSPGITRKLFKLLPEELVIDILEDIKNNKY